MSRREQIEERKKIFVSVVIMSVMAALIVLLASNVRKNNNSETKSDSEEETYEQVSEETNLTLWYYDTNLKKYIEKVCLQYEQEKGVKVTVRKTDYEDYAEKINQANISEKDAPDLFTGSSAELEKMYLAGLCGEIYGNLTDKDFCEVAIGAATYRDKQIAYPLCFDTAFMVCNTDYTGVIPKTLDELLDFCDNFDGEKHKKVRSILEWDVNELIFNYGFAGAYIGCPGMPLSDYEEVVVRGKKINDAMKYYKRLSQYFSINSEDINYNKVKKDFKEGKLVYSIVKSDFVNYMKNSKTKYKVCVFPQISDKLATKTMSETTVIYISPFSKQSESAEMLAKYMTLNSPALINDLTPYTAAKKCKYKSKNMSEIYKAYENSAGESTYMNYASFKIYARIALNKLWNGGAIKETLEEFEKSLL